MSVNPPIKHPLPIDTVVEANKPQCPCKGASFTKVVGKVKKVISNQSGHWYYLDSGYTVSAQWVVKVL